MPHQMKTTLTKSSRRQREDADIKRLDPGKREHWRNHDVRHLVPRHRRLPRRGLLSSPSSPPAPCRPPPLSICDGGGPSKLASPSTSPRTPIQLRRPSSAPVTLRISRSIASPSVPPTCHAPLTSQSPECCGCRSNTPLRVVHLSRAGRVSSGLPRESNLSGSTSTSSSESEPLGPRRRRGPTGRSDDGSEDRRRRKAGRIPPSWLTSSSSCLGEPLSAPPTCCPLCHSMVRELLGDSGIKDTDLEAEGGPLLGDTK